MSDIVNAFKQTKGYKKRKDLLSDTQEVAQTNTQEPENTALKASQQDNIAFNTSGTRDSDRLAQLQQLAAAETAQNEANKRAAEQAQQQAQQQQQQKTQLSEQANNVYKNAHNDNNWKKYYDEEKQKVRDSAFKNDGFGSWLQDVFNAGWDARLAEQNARNRYASELLNKAWDENGNVKDQNAVYQAQGIAAYNVDRGRQLGEIERANSRALGASYDSDFNPFEATANAIRRMDLGNAILQGDESDAAGVGKFLLNLVPGMLSAPITGGTNISEAISGQGLDSETGKRKDLDGLERLGRGLSGAIDAAGVFYGGSGEAISSISNQIFKKGATEAAKTVAKQTSKQVMKDFAKAMLQEGTEEAVQQAFEFFGDGGKIITKDGEFDGEAFKELAKQVAQAGALGAVGGGIFHGVSLGTNAIGSNLNNRRIKAQNTNTNLNENTNLNTDTNQDLNVGDTDTNLGDTDYNENVGDTNQNIEQQAKDVSTETNTNITPAEMTQNADASARVVEKSDALRDILNDSQKQAFNDRVKEIRSDLEQNKISYTEYLQKVEALQNEFTQQVEGAEVQQQEQSATGQQVNPEDVSNIVEGAENTNASEVTTKQTTPVESFSETNNEATNTQPEMTEGMAQTEGVDPLEQVYDNARQRYQEALQTGDRGAIEAARERYNQALEIKVRQDAIEFTDYDYNNGIKINDVLAQKMFNDGYDSARTLADQMFDITEGNVPLAYDYGTGTPLYMYEDIVAAMRKYGGRDAIGNQFQTSRAILNERNNARNQAFRQAVDESIAQNEPTEMNTPEDIDAINDLLAQAAEADNNPVIDQSFDDRVADEYGRQEMASEDLPGTPEQRVAPESAYARFQEEYSQRLNDTGMTPELRRKIYTERYNAKVDGRTPDLNSVLNSQEQAIAKKFFNEKANGDTNLANDMYNSAYMTAQNEGTEYSTRALTEVLDTGTLSDIYKDYKAMVTPENYDASGLADADYMIRRDNPDLLLKESADAYIQEVAPNVAPEVAQSASNDLADAVKEMNTASNKEDGKLTNEDMKAMKASEKIDKAGEKVGKKTVINDAPRGLSDDVKLKNANQWYNGAYFGLMERVDGFANTSASEVNTFIQNKLESLTDKQRAEILSSRNQRFNHFMEVFGNEKVAEFYTNRAMLKDALTQNLINYRMQTKFTNEQMNALMNDYTNRYLLQDRYTATMMQKIAHIITRSMNSSMRGMRWQTTLNEIPEIFTSMADFHTFRTAKPSECQEIKARYGMAQGSSLDQVLGTMSKEDARAFRADLEAAGTPQEQANVFKQWGKKIGEYASNVDTATQWNGFVQDWKDATYLKNAEQFYYEQGLRGFELKQAVLNSFDERMLPMSRVFKILKSDKAFMKILTMYVDSSLRLTRKAVKGVVGMNKVGVNANYKPIQRIANNSIDFIPRAISAMIMGVPMASVLGLVTLTGDDYSGISDEDKNELDVIINTLGQFSPLTSLVSSTYNNFRQDQIADEKGYNKNDVEWGERAKNNILKTITPLGNWLDQEFGTFGNRNSLVDMANRGYAENKNGRVQYLAPDNPIDWITGAIAGMNKTSNAREYNNNPDLLSAIMNTMNNPTDYNEDGQPDGGFADFFQNNAAINSFPFDLNTKNDERYNRPASDTKKNTGDGEIFLVDNEGNAIKTSYNDMIQEAFEKGDIVRANELYNSSREYNAILDNLRVNNRDAYDVYYDQFNNNYVTPEKWKTVFLGKTSDGKPDLAVWNTMKELAKKVSEDFGTPIDPAYNLDDERSRRYLQYKSTATGEDIYLKNDMVLDPFWENFFKEQRDYYSKLPKDNDYDKNEGKTERVVEWNRLDDMYSDYMNFIGGRYDSIKNSDLGQELANNYRTLAEYTSFKAAMQAKYGDEYKNSQEYKAWFKEHGDAYNTESEHFNANILMIINEMRKIEGFDPLPKDAWDAIQNVGKDKSSNKSGYSKRSGGYSYAPYFENTFQAAPVYASVPKAGKMRYNPAGRANFNKVPMSGTMGGQPYAAV